MKFGTSFFSSTVLRRNITRFLPVWGGYLLALLIQCMIVHHPPVARTASELLYSLDTATILLMIYAPICAGALFGDLFHPGRCSALHALPLRREGWFFTHLLSGLLFFLVPAGIFSCLMLPLTGEYGFAVLIWLVANFLQFLVFFGLAVFSCLCAGNRLGMLAVYALLNYSGVFLQGMVQVVYEPLLYGIRLKFTGAFHIFDWLSPSVLLQNLSFADLIYHYESRMAEFHGLYRQDWFYLGIYVAVSIGLTALSLVLYRRRKLEASGDFLAVRFWEPVFLVVFSLAAGLVLTLGSTGAYAILTLGICVGFLGGKMLIARSLRVFRWKTFLQLGSLVAVLALSMAAIKADVLGIIRMRPAAEDVASVKLATTSAWNGIAPLDTPEDIALALDLHTYALENRAESATDTVTITLDYTLKDGSTLQRLYPLSLTGDAERIRALEKHLSRWDHLCEGMSLEQLQQRVTIIELTGQHQLPPETYAMLLEAIHADCAEGNLPQDWALRSAYDYQLRIVYADETKYHGANTFYVWIYPESVHTQAAMDKIDRMYPGNFSKEAAGGTI